VESFFDDINRAYQVHIEAAGKEIHFLILVGFAVTFGFIRTSAHLIRAQVSWWPGNVQTKGGTHIHHLVWGILLILVMGYLGLAIDMGSPWLELTAICFGIGMGLTLDEFALWLNLEDVYWESKGRQSIDAVVIAASLLGISLLGLWFWIDVYEAFLLLLGFGGERFTGSESAAFLIPWQLLGIVLAVFCLTRGKRFTGIVGVFIPLVALIGAVQLVRSPEDTREPTVTK
jgi:lysyl-tRNA synthetase, class II